MTDPNENAKLMLKALDKFEEDNPWRAEAYKIIRKLIIDHLWIHTNEGHVYFIHDGTGIKIGKLAKQVHP